MASIRGESTPIPGCEDELDAIAIDHPLFMEKLDDISDVHSHNAIFVAKCIAVQKHKEFMDGLQALAYEDEDDDGFAFELKDRANNVFKAEQYKVALEKYEVMLHMIALLRVCSS